MSHLLLRRGLRMATAFCNMFLCGLLLVAIVPANKAEAQVPASGTGAFPEKLLEGTVHFDLALSLQGDLRGNFGPCG